MAIKSNIAASLCMGTHDFVKEIGPFYTGVCWSTSSSFKVRAPGAKYCDRKHVNRTFCSCGYEAASVEEPASCPKCGGRLVELQYPYSGVDNTLEGKIVFCQVKGGDTLEQYEATVKVSPHFVGGSTDIEDINNLRNLDVDIKRNLLCSVKKESDGTYDIHRISHGSTTSRWGYSTRNNNVKVNEEILDFFGDDIWFIEQRDREFYRVHHDAEIVIDNGYLHEYNDFPVVMKSVINNEALAADIVKLIQVSGGKGTNNRKIPREATIEEFLDAVGFSVSIFPLSWIGRSNISFGKRDLNRFTKSQLGQIVFSRIANGEAVKYDTVNSMYRLWTNMTGDAKDEYDEALFVSFMKDTVDQYGFDNIVGEFNHRVAVLKGEGILPTEDNLRTRAYCQLVNEKAYRPKKPIDIPAMMQKDPLTVLKSLMIHK